MILFEAGLCPYDHTNHCHLINHGMMLGIFQILLYRVYKIVFH